MANLSEIKETINRRMSASTDEKVREERRIDIGLDIVSCFKMRLISYEESRYLHDYLFSL